MDRVSKPSFGCFADRFGEGRMGVDCMSDLLGCQVVSHGQGDFVGTVGSVRADDRSSQNLSCGFLRDELDHALGLAVGLGDTGCLIGEAGDLDIVVLGLSLGFVQSYTGDYLSIEGIAEELHVVMGYDQKVVSADMGVFFNTVIS